MCVYLGTKFQSYEMDEGMNLTPTPSTTTTPPPQLQKRPFRLGLRGIFLQTYVKVYKL